jgi:ubiquinone/menaquinone biosynthesis C-methylase UbiE
MTKILEIFAALADPTRLRILSLLRAMELSVGELAQALGQSQPRVSRHVKILADAGIAERRKEGSWVFLGLGDSERIAPLLSAIDAWTAQNGEDPWTLADTARLAAIRADRAAAAEEYFDANAAKWDAMRSLHVAESEVEDAIRDALKNVPIGRLVDIGTGTGRMIELFGTKAETAIGVDRSPEMLRLARAKLASAGLQHADLRQGDLYALPLPNQSADMVILHQVLHYAQAPGAAIAEAARLLAPHGRLLVVDFGPHENEELRSQHAHARLGFTDEQIAGWFAAAGLQSDLARPLEGGELTVKLWLAHRPANANLKEVAA